MSPEGERRGRTEPHLVRGSPGALVVVLAAFASGCGSDGSDEPMQVVDAGPSGPDALVAPVCVEPMTANLVDNLGFGGMSACLDTGLRGGAACPAALHDGVCPPNVAIEELVVFVMADDGDRRVLVGRPPKRASIASASHGVVSDDQMTVTQVPAGVDVTVEAVNTDGDRLRVVFRFGDTTVAVSELHHEDPLRQTSLPPVSP